jgi:Rieske Fe-S protein
MKRREFITVVGGLALGVDAAQSAKPERMKPDIGDVLVLAFGDNSGSVIHPDDIQDTLVFAFPMSPDGVVRSGTLHNQLSLLRLDEASMSSKTRRYAAGPIIAISAACTHTGCEIDGWDRETQELICPCHGSRFDVLDAAKVMQGPAIKPLALLPIEQEQGSIRVTGKFSRRVGPEPVF